MTAPSTATKPARLALFGEGELANHLEKAATRAGLTLQSSLVASQVAEAECVWVLPGADAGALHALNKPQAIVITGYQPAPGNAANLPLLRLTQPFVAGSLAEISPSQHANDALSEVFADIAGQLGYTAVTIAGASEGFAQSLSYRLMIEAMALLGEGVAPAQIEAAALEFGFAQAPLLMIDHLSLGVLDKLLHDELHQLEAGEHKHDHGHDHGEHKHHDHGGEHGHDHKHEHDHEHKHDHGHSHHGTSERMPESAVYVLEKMAHGFDRSGVVSGYGFYEHEEDGSAELWDGLNAFSRGARNIPTADIQDRLVWAFALEARRCVQAGLIDTSDADTAAITGCGFPAATGGVLQWISKQGDASFTARANALAGQYGKRFNAA